MKQDVEQLFIQNLAKLKVVVLDEESEENKTNPLEEFAQNHMYVVLGEAGNSHHYILARFWPADPHYGLTIMPGIYELCRFREIVYPDEL